MSEPGRGGGLISEIEWRKPSTRWTTSPARNSPTRGPNSTSRTGVVPGASGSIAWPRKPPKSMTV